MPVEIYDLPSRSQLHRQRLAREQAQDDGARYRMLKTTTGSPDGLNVYLYEEGREYDRHSRPPLYGRLAELFVKQGWAEVVEDAAQDAKEDTAEPEAEPEIEQKAEEGAPENKAVEPTENKRSGRKRKS